MALGTASPSADVKLGRAAWKRQRGGVQKGKKSTEAGEGRNKVERVGGKMGKETTKDKACVGTTVQEELEQPQKGHSDAWEGAAVQEPARVPKGDYRGK